MPLSNSKWSWEAYTVSVDLDRFCNPNAVISTQYVKIEDPPIAKFSTIIRSVETIHLFF